MIYVGFHHLNYIVQPFDSMTNKKEIFEKDFFNPIFLQYFKTDDNDLNLIKAGNLILSAYLPI